MTCNKVHKQVIQPPLHDLNRTPSGTYSALSSSLQVTALYGQFAYRKKVLTRSHCAPIEVELLLLVVGNLHF